MTGKKGKREPPLYLDMDFGEALRRYAQVDPAEIPDNKKLKRKKATGATKAPAGQSDTKGEGRRDRGR